ncbi:MAG: flagellar biosynthetic protein FliO [Polyangiaceae bacterium]
MSAARRSTVKRLTALALGLSGLTFAGRALADETEAPIAGDVANVGPGLDAAAGTPLKLRQEAPALANEPPREAGVHFGYGALLLGALGLGGGIAYLRRRRGQPLLPTPAMRVVSRQSLGPKSALVLVEVDDQRLLLGVTSGSIRTLHHWGTVGETEALDEVTPADATLDEGWFGDEPTEAMIQAYLAEQLGTAAPDSRPSVAPSAPPSSAPPALSRHDLVARAARIFAGEDRDSTIVPSRKPTPSGPRAEFEEALGHMERRLARYRTAGAAGSSRPPTAPPESLTQTVAPRNTPTLQGGGQAQGLARLRKAV